MGYGFIQLGWRAGCIFRARLAQTIKSSRLTVLIAILGVTFCSEISVANESIGSLHKSDLFDRGMQAITLKLQQTSYWADQLALKTLHLVPLEVESEGPLDLEELYEKAAIRVSPYAEYAEDGRSKVGAKVKVKIPLPIVKSKLKLAIENFDADQEVFDPHQERTEKESLFEEDEGIHHAGLDLASSRFMDIGTEVGVGLRLKSRLEPRIGAKVFGKISHKNWNIKLSQRVLWDGIDGFGTRSQFQLRRMLRPHAQILFNNSALWSETSQGVEWGHSVHLDTIAQGRHFVSWIANVEGHGHRSYEADYASTYVKYGHRLYKDYLHLELKPGVDFRADEDFEPSLFIRATVHIFFGAIPKV